MGKSLTFDSEKTLVSGLYSILHGLSQPLHCGKLGFKPNPSICLHCLSRQDSAQSGCKDPFIPEPKGKKQIWNNRIKSMPISDLKASLVVRPSFRTARATQENLGSKNKTRKPKGLKLINIRCYHSGYCNAI